MVTRTTRPTPIEISGYLHPTPDTWVLHHGFTTNPVPMNGPRGSHYAAAAKARMVRSRTLTLARAARIPALGRCEAHLVWWVNTNRRRDVDNLARLEKPMFDALVDAGIVPDDTPDLMVKPRPNIWHVDRADGLISRPGFTLHIRRLDDEDDA